MRFVLDTSVLVAALASQLGASNRVLRAVARRQFRPLVSTAVFLEYQAVLLRAEQRLATGMNVRDVEGFLAALASAAETVETGFCWRPQLRDPSSELILEAAVIGQAGAIVTHNAAVFEAAAARFGVRGMTPAEFLKEQAPS